MKPQWSFAVASLIAVFWVHAPRLATACAVCTAGKDEENAFAFLMTTIFMSIMPLAAIGTLVFVLWRRIRKLEAEPPPERTPQPHALAIYGGHVAQPQG